MKLQTIQQFRKSRDVFEPESMPSENTLRSWIDEGEIPGKRIGRKYYVDLDALKSHDDALVSAVLEAP